MKRKRKSYFTKDLLIEFRGCFSQNKNTKETMEKKKEEK